MLGQITPFDPIALRLGPLTVTWYGLIIGSGIVLGYILATREGKRRDFRKNCLQIYFYGRCRFPSFPQDFIT